MSTNFTFLFFLFDERIDRYEPLCVRIKPPSRKHIIRSRQRDENSHWWLIESKPKKVGRLPQLNKSNRRARRMSEFQTMVRYLENEKSS